ncbi:MAG: monovalent cation/H(+) antiporter subunit G [Xanthomonadales bacterium]|nr:Na(+)/H(+) antiporter subunit G1 [Xanthomonadales bacterium]MCC6594369.1 monovalent cation/H(+) antiporter subunit G [Xanthomonadales bacterium]MCE7931224.1 sodium:proton antiporter [Xanthomonadales bacterium PRO6]
MTWLQLLATLLLGAGSLLLLLAGIGLLRFPHFYARLHAAAVVDTLAAALFLAGLGCLFGATLGTVKLGLILLFLLFTSPTACHALARAAWVSGLREPAQPGEPPPSPS